LVELYSAPPDPLVDFGGLLLRGREEKGRRGEGRRREVEERIEGWERKGGGIGKGRIGRGRKGREGEEDRPPSAHSWIPPDQCSEISSLS